MRFPKYLYNTLKITDFMKKIKLSISLGVCKAKAGKKCLSGSNCHVNKLWS